MIEPYIPEQILDYFEPVSGLRHEVLGDYLCYFGEGVAVVVGYPLGLGKVKRLEDIMREVEMKAWRIEVIAPRLPRKFRFKEVFEDEYYRLRLPLTLRKKLRYMVNRAERELTVSESRELRREHVELMEEFLRRRDIMPHMRYVCERLHRYLSKSKTARLLNAYEKKGMLVGFDVIDLPQGPYSFYMFNFIRRGEGYVPGVSDLLLHELVKLSDEEGKKYVNMGLGINEGVRRFKLKWGAEAFLPYRYGIISREDKFSEIFMGL